MIQNQVMGLERFVPEEVSVLSRKYLDKILKEQNRLSKEQIVGFILEFRDRLDQYI
jgi:hypothetical protein